MAALSRTEKPHHFLAFVKIITDPIKCVGSCNDVYKEMKDLVYITFGDYISKCMRIIRLIS